MSDEPQNGGTISQESRGPQAGARLKAARQARNVALDDVARELHIDADMLRALEANRFDVFSAPVFTKGYLRKYASLVGVPEAEVIGEYDRLSGVDEPPPVIIKPPPVRRRYVPSFQAVAVIVLVGLIGLLGWWAFSGSVLKPIDRATDVMPGGPVLPAIEDAGDAPAGDAPALPVAGQSGDAGEISAGESVAGDSPPVPVALPEPEPEPEAVSLVLGFTDECWVEVSDGEGRKLFAGIARAGQTRRFTAEPPISLVLGNADAASIEVNGEPYAIGAEDRRGRTARVTLSGAPGGATR